MPKLDETNTNTVVRRARRRRLWRRVTVRSVLGLVLVLVIALVVLNRTNALGRVVLPQVSAMFNCDAAAGRVSLGASGKIIVRDLRLRVPGIDGPAGQFLSAPRVELSPRWISVLSGSPTLRRLEMDAPHIRLSQDENLELNVALLQASGGGGGGLVPEINLHDGLVEFGEHEEADYRKLTELRVEGDLRRASGTRAGYTFQLRELERPMGDEFDTLAVVGELDLMSLTGEVTLGNLDLRRLSRTRVPSTLQDLWTRMAMNGAVKETTFSYDPALGLAAKFDLHGVDLNIPVPADVDPEDAGGSGAALDGPANDWIAMRDVSGEVSFTPVGLSGDLTGWIEDLNCQVRLQTQGLDLDAGLRCEIEAPEFLVGEQPRLLPFAPWFVRRNFQRFSGPTAVVTGTVVLERDAPQSPGVASDLRVRGELRFVQGNAQFEGFTYPFHDMRGRITFDDQTIVIDQISGIGPTGARLLAQGEITPPTPGARVELIITVADAPYDQHLLDALPPARRDLVEAVFNTEAYQELRLAGLIEQDSDRARRRERLDELDLEIRRARARGDDADRAAQLERERARIRALDARGVSFDLGGLLDQIEIRIVREEGTETEYVTEIDVDIGRAGIVASMFPYPAYATGLRIEIRDDYVQVIAPEIEGLSGATGMLDAQIRFGDESTDRPTEYELDLDVEGISADEFLLAALPSSGSDSEFEPRRVLEALALDGRASCKAKANTRVDGSMGYEVRVSLTDMAASPGSGALRLEHLNGSIVVSDERAALERLTGSLAGGTIEADLSAEVDQLMGSGAPKGVRGMIRARDFDLEAPIEELISVFAPQLGGAVSSLRQTHEPTGRLDALCRLESTGASEIGYDLLISNPRGLKASALGGRLELAQCTGSMRVAPDRLDWDRFGSTIRFDGADAGRLSLSGHWPLGEAKQTLDGDLEISFQRARFDSPVVRRVLALIDPALEQSMARANVRGQFSASGSARQDPGGAPKLKGELRPASLTFQRGGHDIRFVRMDGRITLDGDHGRLDHVIATAPDWSLETSGDWSMGDSLIIDTRFSLNARSFGDDLVALLPEAGRDAFESVELETEGPLVIRNGALVYEVGERESVSRLEVRAQAQFGLTRLRAVVPIEMASGTATIDAGIDTESGESRLDTEIRADRFSAAGIPMETGDLRLMMGEGPGVFVVPHFSAISHRGEVSAQALLRPGRIDPNDPDSLPGLGYEVDLRASGIDFATFLGSLRSSDQESADPSPDDDPVRVVGTRGELDAIARLAGDTSDPAARRGRGTIRIQNGEVLQLPGIMGLLRLSNLQPPIGETLEYASAEFFVRGGELTFDHLEVSSASVVIAGFGTMLWPGMEIDLRFNTRGNRGVPIVSDLLRGVRNELITTRVRGTLRDPEYSIEQLPATRRMLGTIFRGEPKQSPPPRTIEPTGGDSSDDNEGD